MKIIAIIPARMGSFRFLGKSLAKINNIPMTEHCYKRSKRTPATSNYIFVRKA